MVCYHSSIAFWHLMVLECSHLVNSGDKELFCLTLATEQQSLKQKRQASDEGDKGNNNEHNRVFSNGVGHMRR